MVGMILLLVAAPMAAQDSAAKGQAVLKAATAASGGEAAAKVKSVEMKGSGTVNSPMGSYDMDVRFQISFPDRMRVESVLPVAEIQQGFDGKNGWIASPQGSMPMPADLNNEYLRGIALVGGVGVFQQVLEGKAKAEFVGEKEFNGKKAVCVEWMAPSGKVKLFVDAETKLLIGAQYRAQTQQGGIDEERRWSDFKAVEGVQFPTRLQTYRDGALYSDITLKEIKVNPKLEEKIFLMP